MSKRLDERAPGQPPADSAQHEASGADSNQAREKRKRWPLFLLLFSVLLTLGVIALIWPVLSEIGAAPAAAIVIPLIAFSLIPLLLLRTSGRRGRRP
jgi:hypothetical protein